METRLQVLQKVHREKKRNQAGGRGKLGRTVECMPEERACSAWLGEERRIQRERGLVAAPKLFGGPFEGRHLQLFVEGSSALVPKPQPSLGFIERRPSC